MRVYCQVKANTEHKENLDWKEGSLIHVFSGSTDGLSDEEMNITVELGNETKHHIVIQKKDFKDCLREIDPVAEFLKEKGSKKFIYLMFKSWMNKDQQKAVWDEFLGGTGNDFDFNALFKHAYKSKKADGDNNPDSMINMLQ